MCICNVILVLFKHMESVFFSRFWFFCLPFAPLKMNVHLPLKAPFKSKSVGKHTTDSMGKTNLLFYARVFFSRFYYFKRNVIYAFAHMHKTTGTRIVWTKKKITGFIRSCLSINIKDFSISDPIVCALYIEHFLSLNILSKIGFRLQLLFVKRISSYHMWYTRINLFTYFDCKPLILLQQNTYVYIIQSIIWNIQVYIYLN